MILVQGTTASSFTWEYGMQFFRKNVGANDFRISFVTKRFSHIKKEREKTNSPPQLSCSIFLPQLKKQFFTLLNVCFYALGGFDSGFVASEESKSDETENSKSEKINSQKVIQIFFS